MSLPARLRDRAFNHQQGRCYCCELPIWNANLKEFQDLHGLTARQARQCRCTAEHLKARTEGGRHIEENVLEACWYCNPGRHRRKRPPAPDLWRKVCLRRARRRQMSGWLVVRPRENKDVWPGCRPGGRTRRQAEAPTRQSIPRSRERRQHTGTPPPPPDVT